VVALSDGETGYACEPAPGGGAGGLAIVARPLTPHEAREWVRIANAHQGRCAPMHTRTTKLMAPGVGGAQRPTCGGGRWTLAPSR
jgi:hypothetical protein